MDILDDRGRLFGLVNVVDAIVLLLVAVVVVAGVAFVFQAEPEPTEQAPPETDTVTAVLDLGSQPDYIADRISEGDAYSPARNSNLTITDVYVGPERGGARVLLAVELEGPLSEGAISYADAPLRLDRQLTIQTDDYNVDGAIREIGTGLDRQTTNVLVSQTVEATTADFIRSGDSVTLAGREVAIVESVDAFVSDEPDQRLVFLELSLNTVDFGDGPQLGSIPIRRGVSVPLLTENYQISGTIRDIGNGLEQQTTRVLVSQTIDANSADTVQGGDTLTRAGRDAATVESVYTFATDEPDHRRVFLGLSLRTVDLGDGPQLGSIPIRRGATLSFQAEEYAVKGSVVRVGSANLPGEPSSREVTLQLRNIRPQLANSLESGMSERLGDQRNAYVVAVETEPEPVLVTTSDGRIIVREHPDRVRVTLVANLSVRETATGPTFKGRSLQLGRTVHLDLGTVTIEATVVEIGDASP